MRLWTATYTRPVVVGLAFLALALRARLRTPAS